MNFQDCDKKLEKQMPKGWLEQPTSLFPDFESGASDALYH